MILVKLSQGCVNLRRLTAGSKKFSMVASNTFGILKTVFFLCTNNLYQFTCTQPEPPNNSEIHIST